MTHKQKVIVASVLALIALGGAMAASRYGSASKDPVVAKVDPRIYDDYAGHYDFGNNHIVTIRREGERLLSLGPGHLPLELLPETESKFFVRGEPGQFVFHRDETGQVDCLIHEWKREQIRAMRTAAPSAPAACTNVMVVATTAGKAVEAALDVLKEGGSAMDAALATALCEIVHAGGSYVSFGGVMMLLYYDAETGQVQYLDAQYNVPLQEKEAASLPKTGGRTALVPGFMAGVQAGHDRFGKLPFARIFAPAIALAEHGQITSPVMEWWIGLKKSVLSKHPETKRIFTRSDGKFLVTGDLFRQPDLARTLKNVAAQGAAYMYEGEWGRKFVEVIRKHGGKITQEDMKKYKAVWEKPLRTSYRDYEIYAPGLSAWGGVSMVEGLHLLELANLKECGHYTTSPRSLFWLMEISECQRLNWAPLKFANIDLSPKSRATKETSALIWNQMQNAKWPWLPETRRKAGGGHTDGLVVVDAKGNMCVINHTINTSLWGNTGIFVDGVSIPDSAALQPDEVAKAGPGNRLGNAMSPLLVVRDGKAALGSAATGGGLHAKTLQVLHNILDFGMEPQSAVDTPAFVGWHAGTVEKNTFEPKLLAGLSEFGIKKVKPVSDEVAGGARGYWAGICIDRQTGHRKGGVSRGVGGAVKGY
jgi:gamma-glutamyltranspeptidase / glutathione hydrolase